LIAGSSCSGQPPGPGSDAWPHGLFCVLRLFFLKSTFRKENLFFGLLKTKNRYSSQLTNEQKTNILSSRLILETADVHTSIAEAKAFGGGVKAYALTMGR
jgi:hypothetical protein